MRIVNAVPTEGREAVNQTFHLDAAVYERTGENYAAIKTEGLQGILCFSNNNKEEFHRGDICLRYSRLSPDPVDSSSKKTPKVQDSA